MKLVALENMPPILVTLLVFQLLRGWLKEEAPENMPLMVVTLPVFQLLSA